MKESQRFGFNSNDKKCAHTITMKRFMHASMEELSQREQCKMQPNERLERKDWRSLKGNVDAAEEIPRKK